MRPTRTAKSAASRVDETYVQRRRSPLILLLTLLALAVSIAWWALHQTRGNAAIYSPGHVASVHMAWDNNCAECHDGDGRGGFTKHVSDSACLKCHKDVATVHSPHQSTMVQTISMAGGSHAFLSAHCAECHVDHRGHETLLARNDSTCLQCHRDVTKFTKGTPKIQVKVTAFALDAHPNFGRALIPKSGGTTGPTAMMDSTPLIFNHKSHLEKADIKSRGCTGCHEPPAPAGQGVGVGNDQRYMQPVSFEKHCASCHPMEAVAGTNTRIPHVAMDLVRPLLGAYADAEGHFRQVLAAMTPEQRNAILIEKIPTYGPPPLKKKTGTTTIQHTPEEWAAGQAKNFWAAIKKWYLDDSNQLPGLDDVKTALQAGTDFPPELKTAQTLEYFVTHARDKNDNKCGLCHKLSDDSAAVKFLQENAGPPMTRETILAYRSGKVAGAAASTTAPTTSTTRPAASPINTLPTGIGSTPRRWFVNSVFDHSAHRFDYKTQTAMSCDMCHANGSTSEQMSDVLLPTSVASCVACHHAADTTGPGATDSCTSCHPFYHDRTRESILPAPTLSAMASPAPTAQP